MQHNRIAVAAVFAFDFDRVALDDLEMQPSLAPDLDDVVGVGMACHVLAVDFSAGAVNQFEPDTVVPAILDQQAVELLN